MTELTKKEVLALIESHLSAAQDSVWEAERIADK